ncbi:hypothetical protein MSMEI_4554 [Mycolicibacterium smegmatis MC2 155]|uniref:Uncharacterized protein n=1 Tax=Mycolicibacterium smegmatis (strain ATCC 700084 / mc(2)155) TaxID=246196 RepID=I7FQJ3_MYCS2|nr:hypothetical protein MSMEI_4554 [Mycolicibacterium smegmatis MC2 155]
MPQRVHARACFLHAVKAARAIGAAHEAFASNR